MHAASGSSRSVRAAAAVRGAPIPAPPSEGTAGHAGASAKSVPLKTALRAAVVAVLAARVVALPAAAAAPDRYVVTLDSALSRFEVSACFAGEPPATLSAASPEAGDFLGAARYDDGAAVERRGATLRLNTARRDACIRYEIDLDRVERGPGVRPHRAQAVRLGATLMMSPSMWLWRPADGGHRREAEIGFRLPPGHDVSAPWPRLPDPLRPREVRFALGGTPPDWSATVALGRLLTEEIPIGPARLRLAVVPAIEEIRLADLRTWIATAAGTVADLYGEFPLASVQVLLVPVNDAGEAVPFAQVLRGGGSALRFFVDPRHPLDDFMRDWTAVHEFSHLLHPFFRDEDVWLAEGLASYYQNVLRARSHVLSPREAWQELHAGFERGRRQATGLTLEEAARRMYRDRAFMRVYWSGAAIVLLADLRLREASAGRESLDSAMRRFRDCCLPSERIWSAGEYMMRLDELTGAAIFGELYREHAETHRFPDLGAAYERLGLRLEGGAVALEDSAPSIVHRDAIMRGRAPTDQVRSEQVRPGLVQTRRVRHMSGLGSDSSSTCVLDARAVHPCTAEGLPFAELP
jgi:hypothetical protein